MSKIAFIGGGNMARALIGGLINSGKPASDLLVAEPMAAARQRLVDDFGIQVSGDNNLVAQQAECMVLAVKPQVAKGVVSDLAGAVKTRRPLLVSIVAGIPLQSLERWLGGDYPVVRTMPNMAALVGMGITALVPNERVTDRQRLLAEQIMQAAGTTLWVDEEHLLDAVTAVSGSGPAYFFRVMEAMIEAGKELGLSAQQAAQLTLSTAAGAAELAIQSDHSVARLREQVTSPGGTTAAALAVMDKSAIGDIFSQALRAACLRAAELAEEADS